MWNKDEVRGKADKTKGRIEQGAGDVMDNERIRGEGQADKIVGKTEETFGKGRRKVDDALKNLGHTNKH
jgi:uncharacterized protein YjbJ (UPF0337 family)